MPARQTLKTASPNQPRLGWMYLSDEDIQQAERLIDSLKEEDAADSLGLRPLSDLFAEWLYPALTTPMTHTRYFIFVKTMFGELEERSHASAASAREAGKRLQLELVKAIGAVKGNIGRRSWLELERWPATIYWNSLRSLGIFTQPMSEQRYYGALVQGSKRVWDSEDGAQHSEGVGFWDEKCPDAQFDRRARSRPQRLSFELTSHEGNYLLKRFQSVDGYRDSLLRHRLEERGHAELAYPWQVRASGLLRRRLLHARALSAAAMGLSLVYVHLMHAERKEEEESDETWKRFLAWQRRAEDLVSKWDIKDLQALLQQAGYVRARSDSAFFAKAQPLLAGHANFSRRAICTVVREREITRRNKKCRLCRRPAHKRYVKQWKAPDLGDRMYFYAYRNLIGNTVVREIVAALKRAHVSSN